MDGGALRMASSTTCGGMRTMRRARSTRRRPPRRRRARRRLRPRRPCARSTSSVARWMSWISSSVKTLRLSPPAATLAGPSWRPPQALRFMLPPSSSGAPHDAPVLRMSRSTQLILMSSSSAMRALASRPLAAPGTAVTMPMSSSSRRRAHEGASRSGRNADARACRPRSALPRGSLIFLELHPGHQISSGLDAAHRRGQRVAMRHPVAGRRYPPTSRPPDRSRPWRRWRA